MPAGGRVWLSGFVVMGVLLGVPGSLIIAWQYHIDVVPQLIGLHFLSLGAGYAIAAVLAEVLLRRLPSFVPALISCLLASAGLIGLAFLAPPVAFAWRLASLSIIGLGAGGLAASLLQGSERRFEESPAAANYACALFGAGCLLSTQVMGATYFSGFSNLAAALLAIVPLVSSLLFAVTRASTGLHDLPAGRSEARRLPPHDSRRIAAALLCTLLLLQFGNEWAIAGWLPFFLIHRLGSNPVLAIGVLAIYFLALTLGRLLTQALPPGITHRKLLAGSISVSFGGLLLLSFANSLGTATSAAVIIAVGFAPIYPLLAGRLDGRITLKQELHSAKISVAISGALCAPFLLGFAIQWLGMSYAMLVPALGSIMVALVSLLLMLEAHLMSDRTAGRLEAVASARK